MSEENRLGRMSGSESAASRTVGVEAKTLSLSSGGADCGRRRPPLPYVGCLIFQWCLRACRIMLDFVEKRLSQSESSHLNAAQGLRSGTRKA